MDIIKSIVAILATTPKAMGVEGAGFITSDGFILSCAHVVENARRENGIVLFQYFDKESPNTATIEYSDKVLDIAVLRPTQIPDNYQALPLISANVVKDHDFETFGFPQMGSFKGLYGQGKVLGIVKDNNNLSFLELVSLQVTHGYSGSPIFDKSEQAVVGIISGGLPVDNIRRAHHGTSFAIPSDRFKEFFPSLIFGKQFSDAQTHQEILYSNLLEIENYGKKIYVASTNARGRNEVYKRLYELKAQPGNEFILRSKTIISFHNLSDYPWNEMCNSKAVLEYSSDDWALTEDVVRKNEFIDLLNKSLETKLYPEVVFDRDERYYYFAATPNLAPKELPYPSLKRNTSRVVFKGYFKKTENKIGYYRHSAFWGKFLRFGEKWYLEITPHYRFTINGHKVSRFADEQLKKIKRLELNPAVLGQVVMWSEYLHKRPDMFSKEYPFLSFGELASFEINNGLDDDAWLKREDEDNQMLEIVKSDVNDLPLFKISEM